jgi:hypothetical protein
LLRIAGTSVAATATIAALAGCEGPGPVVIIDNVHNRAFSAAVCRDAEQFLNAKRNEIARSGCGSIAGCPAITAARTACTGGRRDPARVRLFVTTLRQAMAQDRACAGVRVFNGAIDAAERTPDQDRLERGPYWSLAIDYVPGRPDQDWSLSQLGSAARSGHGWVVQIASDACRIARRGAGRSAG